MKKINVLWTGGLDSTFRMCQLALQNVEINPYYIIDKNRKSTPKELAAIRNITKELRKNNHTKATINPLKIIQQDDIPKNESITNAWQVLKRKYKLGSQYDFLARFAHQLGNEGLELGVTFDPRGKIARTVYGEGAGGNIGDLTDRKDYWLAKRSDGKNVFTYMPIDYDNASSEFKTIFWCLNMPLSLFQITKPEEYKGILRMSFEKIAELTWFCHTPVLGMPCGQCNPCKDALNEGMEWRLPLTGRILGGIRNFVIFPFKASRKLLEYIHIIK